MYNYNYVNERCRRKGERSKLGQTNNKAKQHSTPHKRKSKARKNRHIQEFCLLGAFPRTAKLIHYGGSGGMSPKKCSTNNFPDIDSGS